MKPIVGIDLGTTNSEIAYIFNGDVEILTQNDDGIVPSCVGLDAEGRLIVGIEAKNQAVVSPQNTVSSVKRLMGSDQTVMLDGKAYTPQEISAFILKELKNRAESVIGKPVEKAVITVPAYFTDAQRKATREAGSIAGLEVVRIINEPTAAALAYEKINNSAKTVLVFDLGGGTFDVSIVKIEQSVVEVLSSTGDNHLGGDDFDKKLADHFESMIKDQHSVSVNDNPIAMARLVREAEKAKIALTDEPFVQVEIDHIAEKKGTPVHFSYSLSRDEFEALIKEYIEKTMNSVSRALEDASMQASALDRIILVGGSTRMPMISRMLQERLNMEAHGEIDPDLCVALGAGIQAGREMGIENSAVLIDITPYTFGTSAIGTVDNMPTLSMFVPIIKRNSKLPASKSDVFYTMVDSQEAVDVMVYQGEHRDAEENLLIGRYRFNLSGDTPENSPIVMKYNLDVNGILKIEAIEKESGKKLEVTIENAFANSSIEAIDASRDKLDELWGEHAGTGALEDSSGQSSKLPQEIMDVIDLAKSKLDEAPPEDRDEIINLIEDIQSSAATNDMNKAKELSQKLDDILFYID